MDKNKTRHILRYLGNELTAKEKADFESWVKTNPENARIFEELKEVWEKTKHYPVDFKPDAGNALKKVQQFVRIDQNKSLVRKQYIVLRIAAVAILLFSLIGVSRYIYLNSSGEMVVVNNLNSGAKEITLPDSTHVWLNTNSTLFYPDRFSRTKRKVYLTGEAYFEVFKNAKLPFYVNSENSRVTVLGTHFNVSAYPTLKSIIVTVAEGKVKFASLDNTKQSVILVGNESAVLDKETLMLEKGQISDPNYLAWKTNLIEFTNTPLVDVFKVLEKHFNANHKISAEHISGVKVSGRFNNMKLDEILYSISQATNVEIILKNDTILIR